MSYRTAAGRVVCTHFLHGHCRDGSKCQYAHENPASGPGSAPPPRRHSSAAATAAAHGAGQPPAKMICRYYHSPEGQCRKGDACPALHSIDWRHDNVRFPWSPANVAVNPETRAEYGVWNRVSAVLAPAAFPVSGTSDLEELMLSVLPIDAQRQDIPTELESLLHVIDYILNDAERKEFFERTLPWMRQTVVDCPTVHFPPGSAIPLLRQNESSIVRVTAEQAAALMCCAFFSLFPFRHRFASRQTQPSAEMQRYAGMLPNFNFGFLFGVGGVSNRHKIRCLIEYFMIRAAEAARPVADSAPTFVVEVTRHVAAALPNFRECTLPISKSVTVQDNGAIEDCTGWLEADFANKLLGGGVIGRGCVQEEIRFAINPEMFIARLVCEQLLPNEVVYMTGTRQYSLYKGYADSFTFAGRCPPPTRTPVPVATSSPKPRAMVDVAIVAMDATNYNQWNLKPEHQFFPQWVARDVGKAAIAFSGSPLSAHPSVSNGPVVTGNWGCGAFGGDLELKFLQQLCAASAAGRPMIYYTFGKPELCEGIKAAHAMCVEAGMRVCDLYSTLLAYCDERVVEVPSSVIPPDPSVEALQRQSTLDYSAAGGGTSPPQRTRSSVPRIRSVFEHLKREIDGEL